MSGKPVYIYISAHRVRFISCGLTCGGDLSRPIKIGRDRKPAISAVPTFGRPIGRLRSQPHAIVSADTFSHIYVCVCVCVYENFQVRRASQVKGCGASCRPSDLTCKVGTAEIKCVRTAENRFEKSEWPRSAPHLCNL